MILNLFILYYTASVVFFLKIMNENPQVYSILNTSNLSDNLKKLIVVFVGIFLSPLMLFLAIIGKFKK